MSSELEKAARELVETFDKNRIIFGSAEPKIKFEALREALPERPTCIRPGCEGVPEVCDIHGYAQIVCTTCQLSTLGFDSEKRAWEVWNGPQPDKGEQ